MNYKGCSSLFPIILRIWIPSYQDNELIDYYVGGQVYRVQIFDGGIRISNRW